MTATREIRVPALEVVQSPGRVLYSFAIDGKLIPRFATVSRIHRQGTDLKGYQRPEVLSHIAEIRSYLECQSPMIPNAVVIAFDRRVRFECEDERGGGYTRLGTLIITIGDHVLDEEKPGFIVDGQQRLAAIRDAAIDSFPICVTAFVTSDLREQTEQFILVNSTKPLPKSLIYELLPGTEGMLPSSLKRRRFPAYLLDRLNRDELSPLRNMIQTQTTPEGVIKDNSMIRMLENSLSDGVLYRFRGNGHQDADTETMLGILQAFWSAVRTIFHDAWGLSPKRSRLMHGAGVVSMGFLMDAIAERHRASRIPSESDFLEDLVHLRDICRWTEGYWDFGPGCQRKWNEIQNTSKDVRLLANYLLIQYKMLVWGTSDRSKNCVNAT